jgi:hypothetical protein
MNETQTAVPYDGPGSAIGAHSAPPPPHTAPPQSGAGSPGAPAADQAKEVAAAARSGAADTMSEVKDQAGEVLGQAKAQAQTVLQDAKREVHTQASHQTERATQGLRSLAEQVRALAEGRPGEAGIAGEYAQRLGQRVGEVADRMEHGGLDGMLDDARRFARRRPGTFLLSAAVVGFAAGRLLRAGASKEQADQSAAAMPAASPTSFVPGTAERLPDPPYGTPGGYPSSAPPAGSVPVSSMGTPGPGAVG